MAWLPVSCVGAHSVHGFLEKHHIPPKDFSIKGRSVPGSPPLTLSQGSSSQVLPLAILHGG